jgi:folate-binding Fe-S cluster repair protein YgfZ
MFDTILFRHGDDFLLNCDANFSSHLVKHLKMYKVRRKIDVGPEVDLQTWAVFESVSLTLGKSSQDFSSVFQGAESFCLLAVS